MSHDGYRELQPQLHRQLAAGSADIDIRRQRHHGRHDQLQELGQQLRVDAVRASAARAAAWLHDGVDPDRASEIRTAREPEPAEAPV